MKVYELHSPAFSCNVRLTYNESGVLMNYEVMNKQLLAIVSKTVKLITTEAEFLAVAKEYGLEVTEVDRIVTYEMAYEKYGYKVDKIAGSKAWAKLPKYKQLIAYDFIDSYKAQCKRDEVKMKYIATYLNSECYIR